MSGIMMLRHLGLLKEARSIEGALLYTIESGVHTGDFGDRNSPTVDTTAFAIAIIDNLGKLPSKAKIRATEDRSDFHLPVRPDQQRVMKGNPSTIEIEGIDLFFTSELLAEEIAEQIFAILPSDLKLVSLTNRGTVVWPNGSVYTECSTGYGVRLKGNGKTKSEWWDITNTLGSVIDVSSTEFLNVIDGQRAYSVGQGK